MSLVTIGLVGHGHYAASGDALHYMMIARSIVVGGDLDLSDDYEDPANILSAQKEQHALAGRDGRLRPMHGVGLPLLAAPYFALAYWTADNVERLPAWIRQRARMNRFIALRQLVCLLMIGATAWLAIVFFDVCWQVTGDKAASWTWALIWTLSPPILSHGYVFFTEVPTALIALLVYRWRDAGLRALRHAAVLGFLTGWLMLIHDRNVGLVFALAAICLLRLRRVPRHLSAYLLGLGLCGTCKLGLNLVFWDSIITTPQAQFGTWEGVTALINATGERGIGLLVDARHGLLPTAPIYLAVPAAWMCLWRRSRTSAIETVAITAMYLLLVLSPLTNIHGWRGGWSPAARFLVPIAPFLMLGVPTLLADRRWRWLVMPLLATQLALDAFLWGHPMVMWSEGAGPAPFAEDLFGPGATAFLPTIDAASTPALLGWLGALAFWTAGTMMLARGAGQTNRPQPQA